MNKRLIPFLLLILLFVVGCGNDSEPAAETESSGSTSDSVESEPEEVVEEPIEEPEEEPEPTATPVPTVPPTSTPEPTEAAEEAPEEVNEAVEENETLNVEDINFNLDGVDSYTLAFEFSVIPEGSDQVAQSISMSGVFQTDPPAQIMSMTFEDKTAEDDLSNGTITISLIDGVSYTKLPGFDDCISVPSDEMGENPIEELLTAETFLDGFDRLKRVRPNETINGVESIHYVFDEATFAEDDLEFDDVSGDIYIAADTGYLTRMTMNGKNPSGFDLSEDSSPEDRFSYVFDLTSINEPVEVTLPEGCSAPGEAGSGLPKPADASQISSFGGVEAFQTELSVADTAAFYEEQMPAAGWTRVEEESTTLGELYTEVYTNGAETAQILIAPNGDMTSVTIVIEAVE